MTNKTMIWWWKDNEVHMVLGVKAGWLFAVQLQLVHDAACPNLSPPWHSCASHDSAIMSTPDVNDM